MDSIQLEKINKELITFTRSDFLKNEINQAFFIWNQNEFYTKDFSDISPEDSRYSLFLDWFIYDYVIISTKKSLAEMYWEDNKEKKENLTDVEKLEQMPLPTGGAKKKYASMDANAMGTAAK